MCLWGYVWLRLTFESIDWVKVIAPPQCGWRPHSIHWLPEEKTGWVKGELACLSTFELEHCSSAVHRLGLGLEHMPSAFLFLRPSDLDWNHTTRCPESPVCLALNFGTSHSPQSWELILCNLFIYISYWFYFYGEPTTVDVVIFI